MKELNEDGLMPGQTVDFETLQRVKRQVKEVKQDAGQPAEKPAAKSRRAKVSGNDDK